MVGIALLVCLGLVACGGAPPEILYSDAQLFYRQIPDTGEVVETLRLFVAVRDTDGIADISTITIINDDAELYWEASAEEWVTVDHGGDSWIGLPDIRGLPDQPLPRGRYRVLIEDQSLQEVEGEFAITAPVRAADELVFPALVDDGVLQVVGAERVVMRVFSRAGKLVWSREVGAGALTGEVLREVPDEAGLAAYLSTPPGDALRLLSGPFELPR
jgi:hypothetical protein